LAVCIALTPVCACFLANAGADKKINSAVMNLNEQARWGRIADASALAVPEYREQFLLQHRHWSTDIQLADSEVLNIQLTKDTKQASAIVTYSWYAMKDMTLHETTLRQLWMAQGSGYALASETVVRGDPALLAPSTPSPVPPTPAPPAPDAPPASTP